MQNFAVNLERLRRHYEATVRTYDPISLLDLSHSLRMWVELKSILPKEHPSFASAISFKTASPRKKLIAACKGREYLYAAFPGGVISYAANGSVIGITEKPKTDLSFFGKLQHKNGMVEITSVCAVARKLDPDTQKAIEHGTVSRCSYVQWLGAEAMRVGYIGASSKIESLTISREILIKRVANSLGASHVFGGQSPEFEQGDKANRFDEAIRNTMKYQCGGLPIPYFVLLKIAQDILVAADRKSGNGT